MDEGSTEEGPRLFSDESNRAWEVRAIRPVITERRSRLLPVDHSNGWLLFTLGLERRRLAPVPLGWKSATEADLVRWCGDAGLVESRPRKRAER